MAESTPTANEEGVRLGPFAWVLSTLMPLWVLAMAAFDLPESVRSAIGNWSVLPALAAAAYFAARIAHLPHLARRLCGLQGALHTAQ